MSSLSKVQNTRYKKIERIILKHSWFTITTRFQKKILNDISRDNGNPKVHIFQENSFEASVRTLVGYNSKFDQSKWKHILKFIAEHCPMCLSFRCIPALEGLRQQQQQSSLFEELSASTPSWALDQRSHAITNIFFFSDIGQTKFFLSFTSLSFIEHCRRQRCCEPVEYS